MAGHWQLRRPRLSVMNGWLVSISNKCRQLTQSLQLGRETSRWLAGICLGVEYYNIYWRGVSVIHWRFAFCMAVVMTLLLRSKMTTARARL